MKDKCVIFDIDGVLADNRPMIEACKKEDGTFDREKAKEFVPHLKTNKWATRLADQMYVGYDVIIVTARRSNIRDITEQWLDNNLILHNGLCMKPEGSKIRDEEYKLEMLKTLEEKYDILFMVEDAPKTVKLLRDNDYIVLQPNNTYEGI